MIRSTLVAFAKAPWLFWALADRPRAQGIRSRFECLGGTLIAGFICILQGNAAWLLTAVSLVLVLSGHPARMAEYPVVTDLQAAWVQHSHYALTHTAELAYRRLRASLLPDS